MDAVLEDSIAYTTKKISDLSIGDKLVNLGEVLEVSEKPDSYSLVILRMNQRQVWTFNKEDNLVVNLKS